MKQDSDEYSNSVLAFHTDIQTAGLQCQVIPAFIFEKCLKSTLLFIIKTFKK